MNQMPRHTPSDVSGRCILLCFCALWAQSTSAQFVEVAADVTVTSWRNPTNGVTTERHRHYAARCVVGTDSWLIHDNAFRNALSDWWFTGSNIVYYSVVRKEPYAQDLEDARDWMSEKLLGRAPTAKFARVPHLGQEFVQVLPSSDGGPPNIMVNLPWLAFCSGSFLTNTGRQIPLPFNALPNIQTYDKTLTYAEPGGLPRRIEFRRSDQHLLGCYEVLQSTNFGGRTFPIEFALTVYDRETSRVTARVMGRVTAMKRLEQLDVPVEMRRALHP